MKNFLPLLLLMSLFFLTQSDLNAQAFTESFDTEIPATWTIENGGDANTWIHSGTQARITYGSTAHDDYLISPSFMVTAGVSDRVSVLLAVSGTWTESFNIKLSTTAGTTGADFDVTLESGTETAALPGTLYTFDLSAYAGTSVTVAIQATDTDRFYLYADDFIVDSPPSCSAPTDLAASSITETSANLDWTANSSETNWEVVVQAGGTGEPAAPYGTGTAITSKPYAATSLSANTAYEYYVRADCNGDGSDLSAWVGPFAFTTPCAAFTAPYSEDFENAGALPDCWALSGDDIWMFNTSGPNHVGNGGTLSGATSSGNYYAVVDDSDPNATNAALTSPFIDVSGLTTPLLSFFEISDNEGNASATLTVDVWDGAAWNTVGTYNANTSGWEERIIDLGGITFTGNAQIRFSVADSGSFYDDIAIDDVKVIETPACPKPTMLTATAITADGADLAWMENGTATVWDVEIVNVTAGGAQTMTPTENDVTNPYTATSLSSGTTYEYYVRADCGADNTDVSDWVGPIAFTTLPACGDAIGGLCYSQTSAQEVLVSFAAPPGDFAELVFNAGGVEACCDEVIVYDGLNGTGNIIYGATTGGGLADYSGEGPVLSMTGNISLVVNSDGSATCNTNSYTPFNVTLNCLTPSACMITALAAGTQTACNAVDNTYTQEVVVTYSDAPATGTLDVNGQSFAITSSPQTVVLTGLDSDESVIDVTANFSDDGTCTLSSTALFTAPAFCGPGGCANPIVLTEGAACLTGDTDLYGNTLPFSFCGGSYGDGDDDAVYSFTPAADGNFDLLVSAIDATYAGVFVFAGACPVDNTTTCDFNDTNNGSTADLAIDGMELTGGTTYYIIITTFGSPFDVGFCIEIDQACTIASISDGGTSTACDPLTNEYSQDIDVAFVVAPTSGTLDVTVDGITSSVTVDGATTSPVTVTVAGLTADGATKDVTAVFSADAACTLAGTAVFTAPAPCTVTCGILSIADGGNQVCTGPGGTYSNDFVITYTNEPISGTLDVTVDGITVNATIGTSPQTVTVSGLPANATALDVAVVFSADPTCTLTEAALFTGTDCAYCVAASNGCDEGVDGVEVADIFNTSTGCTAGGYTDYTTITGTMAIGGVYPITVTNGPNTYGTDQGTVWIDWNANLSFDDAGEMYSLSSPDGGATFTGDIIVPTSAAIGSTVMRVRVNYTDTPVSCGNTSYGEVEDYLLNIIVPDDCPEAVNLNGGGVAGIPTGTPINGDSGNATASDGATTSCSGSPNPDDDVWFEFTTDTDGGDVTITIVPSSGFAPVCEIFTGTCAGLTPIVCGTTTTTFATGANETFYVRVFDSAMGLTGGGADERAAGGFTIEAAGAALPAELTSFTGKAMDKYNTLKWETASEQNTSEFSIERSLDGRNNWTVIGTERAAGNSDTPITYSFDDMRPTTQAYYRLNTIDLDGSAQTSSIVSIKRDAGDFNVLLVAPNPTTSEAVVTFESAKEANVNAIVTDITGKVISTLTQDAIRGLNNMTIDLSNAPSGVYFLTMNNGVNNITRRIVKN